MSLHMPGRERTYARSRASVLRIIRQASSRGATGDKTTGHQRALLKKRGKKKVLWTDMHIFEAYKSYLYYIEHQT